VQGWTSLGRLVCVTLTKAVVLAQAGSQGHARGGPPPPQTILPPAPLLPVANRALLSHALDWLAQAGMREAAVVVPQELAGRAQEAAVEVRGPLSVNWFEQLPDEPLAHALGDLTAFLAGEPFVLHLADSLAKQSLRSLTAGRATWDTEALLVMDESRGVELAQVVELRAAADGGHARTRPLLGDCAGVAVMSGDALTGAADLPLDTGHVLEALTERIQQRGGRVGTRGVTGWWRYRGGSDALLEGTRFALEGLRADYDRSQLVDSDLQGAVIVHPEATIESSVVRGPAIIGAGARLCHAYVGPYTSIGEDVVIEGAEVEHSVVLPGASISHLGGRLEASVIGPRSRVFRDFRLPRALRLTVGEGAEVSLT
jgi:glucose-1-phosphate thymidylyltransferase